MTTTIHATTRYQYYRLPTPVPALLHAEAMKHKVIMSDELSNKSEPPLSYDSFKIALFYCYVEIANVNEHVGFQTKLCNDLRLFGRIRVSPEGLNGVLSGQEANLKVYEEQTQTQLGIRLMDVKYCSLRTDLSVQAQLFTSLSIRKTNEVVTLFPIAKHHRKPEQQEVISQCYRRRRRNRTKSERQQQEEEPKEIGSVILNTIRLGDFGPAPHLSPNEWNESLLAHRGDAILIDARNVYESRVGHFKVQGIPTLLTNTRKYTSLTDVLHQSKEHIAGKVVFMFCTGGVRCERASVYLQALTKSEQWKGLEPPKGIYQLEGGIQRYLETFGSTDNKDQKVECLYRGKNFVFDHRRTDPCTGSGVVGNCMLCYKVWDDYDNGFAPSDNREGRCCKCRILVLICDSCRSKVRSWGESNDEGKPDVYCGIEDCINDGSCVSQAELLI